MHIEGRNVRLTKAGRREFIKAVGPCSDSTMLTCAFYGMPYVRFVWVRDRDYPRDLRLTWVKRMPIRVPSMPMNACTRCTCRLFTAERMFWHPETDNPMCGDCYFNLMQDLMEAELRPIIRRVSNEDRQGTADVHRPLHRRAHP
jgi:hypothetical protein